MMSGGGGGPVLKKCTTGGGVDIMSKLPDDVIVHILSFLPLDTAAATSLVSRRWLHLWKHTPKLNFINKNLERDEQQDTYVNRVNSVLKLHKAPSLQEFRIHFYAANKSNHRCHVAKWLEHAFSKRVEMLDLNWKGGSLYANALPLEDVLKNITLPSSGIHSLKVLRLEEIKATGDAIHFFLRNCPMVERLILKRALMTSDLHVVGLSLKHLEIQLFPIKFSIKVSAPDLTFLKIDMDTKFLFLENVPKLVNMIFYCRFHSTLHDFATAAAQLETLTISLYGLQAPFSVPEMPKLKKLVVNDQYGWLGGDEPPFPITCFVRASPCLEEFKVEIFKNRLKEGLFEVPKDGPPIFRHWNLKHFKLSGFCGGSPCGDRIELVRYIVDTCVALEEINISQCDGTNLRPSLRQFAIDVVDTAMEERETFEKKMQFQVPAHLKLHIFNHSHRYKYDFPPKK